MAVDCSNQQRSLYGRRLLPCILDDQAQTHPQKVFASRARSNDISQGFQEVTFQQVANAVNFLAYDLQAVFGPELHYEFETLTYIGLPDLRYSIVVYAAVKCGYKVLLPSPRNPTSTNLLLMEQTKSSKILYAKEMEVMVGQLAEPDAINKISTIQDLGDLLATESPVFPYNPKFEDAVRHPIVVLHSSGSTGLPKPLTMNHGTFTVMDNDRNFPTVAGRKNHDLTIWDFDGTPGRIYAPFPPFHLAGFHNAVMVPLYTDAIPVFGPPLRPASGALVAEIMQYQKLRGCILPPSIAEQLLHEPNGLELFKRLDVFCYAGGPLSQTTGDAISRVTMLCQFYGSTEVGQVRQLVPRREDWSYMEFHPRAKLRFEPSDDDAFELIVHADDTTKDSVALNYNFPDIQEWHTKDLFKRHPTKKDLWRFHGRKDDIIVLSNGEKLNPVPMENLLQGSQNIAGALFTGQNRFQPALLLEMKRSLGDNDSKIIDQIWPVVESANAITPGHGRIVRSMILLANADKPFIRAGKGTVVRKLTEAAYASEIEDLYRGHHQRTFGKAPPLTASIFSSDAIKDLIRAVMPFPLHADSDDLYISGLDSLKTMEAVEALRSSLLPHRSSSSLIWLSAETFYNNPTINQISQIVLDFLNNGVIPQKQNRIAKMSDMLERFASSLTSSQPSLPPDVEHQRLSIVLTGTTGTLGAYLLKEFFHHPKISSISCLNRSPTAERQWHDDCVRRNITKAPDALELTFVTVKFGIEHLGLGHESYSTFVDECDLIIHTAWKVDFNQDLNSFADNIRSVQTFVNWSGSSPRRPRIIFLSSISSVGPWNPAFQNDAGIPEAPIEDLGAALNIGYGESKHVAERLLNRAATEHGVPVSILRVGQIGGTATSSQSKWTQRELVPSMLKTSKSIGLIPGDLPAVDWIPVDVVSKIVVELALTDMGDSGRTPKYYHIINPLPVPWHEFIPSLLQYCGPGAQVVPLSQWVEKLRTFDGADGTELSLKPALKMLKLFSLMVSKGPTTKYQTSAAAQASEIMATIEPVNQKLMQNWLNQSA